MNSTKYQAKIIDEKWLPEIGKLRYDFICTKKQWVKDIKADDGVELDGYDSHAVHFGVFSNNELIAYMRAITASAPCGMMIDHDFRMCLTDEEYKLVQRERSLELSRRVVSPKLSAKESLEAVQYLFYEFYDFCLQNRMEHVYLVQELVTRKIIRKFYGLKFDAINQQEFTFPDGVTVNVDYATISEMEAYVKLNGMIVNYTNYTNYVNGKRR